MSTSGGGIANALLYLLVVVLGSLLGQRLARGRGADPHRGSVLAAALIWLLVAIPSLTQLAVPALLPLLQRDPVLILQHGQVWRLGTSLVVQDGGVAGTVFNLVILAVVALRTVQVWGGWTAFALLLIIQVVFGIAAVFLSPDPGAGNSGATLGLAATMAGAALLRRPGPADLVMAIATAGAGVVLLLLADAHGIAVVAGFVAGLAAEGVTARRRRAAASERSSAPASG